MIIGTKIKQLRTKKGLSQEFIAHALGVSQSKYSRFESGTTSLDWSIIPVLADLFEVELDELFMRERGKTPVVDVILSRKVPTLHLNEYALREIENTYQNLLVQKEAFYKEIIEEKNALIKQLLN